MLFMTRRRVGSLIHILVLLIWIATAAARAESVDPEAYELNLSKGILAFSQTRYDDAVPFFAAALAAKPGDEDARYYLGLIALRMNRPADAERFFQAMLDSNPESGHAVLGLGMV